MSFVPHSAYPTRAEIHFLSEKKKNTAGNHPLSLEMLLQQMARSFQGKAAQCMASLCQLSGKDGPLSLCTFHTLIRKNFDVCRQECGDLN